MVSSGKVVEYVRKQMELTHGHHLIVVSQLLLLAWGKKLTRVFPHDFETIRNECFQEG